MNKCLSLFLMSCLVALGFLFSSCDTGNSRSDEACKSNPGGQECFNYCGYASNGKAIPICDDLCSQGHTDLCMTYCGNLTSANPVCETDGAGGVNVCNNPESGFCLSYCGELNKGSSFCSQVCRQDLYSYGCLSYCEGVSTPDAECENFCTNSHTSQPCAEYCSNQTGRNAVCEGYCSMAPELDNDKTAAVCLMFCGSQQRPNPVCENLCQGEKMNNLFCKTYYSSLAQGPQSNN